MQRETCKIKFSVDRYTAISQLNITLGNSPAAIYLLPGGMYYTLICFYRVFALGNKQSVLSIEDLLLPDVVHTYTITDVYITARNQ